MILKEGLRCVQMVNGAQYAMIAGALPMLKSSADS